MTSFRPPTLLVLPPQMSPDPSFSPSLGTEPPAHHSGSAGGARGTPPQGSSPARSRSGAQGGTWAEPPVPPGLGKVRVTPVLPCHAAVPCVEWAGHGAWHALLRKASDDIRRSGPHRGQSQWPSVYKAVPTSSMRRRDPEGKGVLIYQSPSPQKAGLQGLDRLTATHPLACSSVPWGPPLVDFWRWPWPPTGAGVGFC